MEDTHKSSALLDVDGIQTSRPPVLVVESIYTAHSHVITQMSTECPGISKLNRYGAKQRFSPLVVEFSSYAEVDWDSSNGGSIEFLT